MSAQNNTAGSEVGNAIKGAWNVFHGTGEALRGTINSSVDQAGEAIADRDPNANAATRPATASDQGRRPEEVAGKGADEVQRGFNAFK